MPLPALQTLLYQVEDGIATVTLNRPEKMNAFTPLMRGVDRVMDGVVWARNNAPILSGTAVFLLVVRPRFVLRWARRGRSWFPAGA